MFRRLLIALDIGPNSVKALQLKRTPAGLHLARIGIRDYPGPLDPRREADRPLIIETVKDLFRTAKFKTRKVVFAIPRYHCFVERIELPTEDERKIKQIISLNLSDYIPLPANRVYYSFKILKKEQGKTVLLLAACKREIVDGYLSIVRGAGLIPSIIETSSQAILNATRLNYPQEEVVAVLEVKDEMSELVVITRGESLFSRGFLLGGTDRESLLEIQRSLDAFRVESQGTRIDRIVLAGEGAVLPGIKDFIEKELDLKVEMADPLRGITFDRSDIQRVGHRLMEGIGLAIRGMQDRGLNLLPHERTESPLQKRRVLVALPSLIPLILLLALGLLSIDLRRKEEKLRATDQRLAAISDELKKVRAMKRGLALVGRFKEEGVSFINILKELNHIIPDKVWLTEFSLDQERLHIQGKALKDSDVADLLQALNNSPCFKEVILISSGLAEIEERETIDFQIDCLISNGSGRRDS